MKRGIFNIHNFVIYIIYTVGWFYNWILNKVHFLLIQLIRKKITVKFEILRYINVLYTFNWNFGVINLYRMHFYREKKLWNSFRKRASSFILGFLIIKKFRCLFSSSCISFYFLLYIGVIHKRCHNFCPLSLHYHFYYIT